MNNKLSRLLVNQKASIKNAMRVIDRGTLGIAFVVDKNKKLCGVVTDGEIRRAVLKGINIARPIIDIANKKPIFIKGKPTANAISDLQTIDGRIKKRMQPEGSLKIPVVDDMGVIKDIVFIYDKKSGIPSLGKKFKQTETAVKNVLLVGGAGYLGSVLSRKLLDAGYKVRVLDNLTYGDTGIKDLFQNKNFEFLKGDARDISAIIEAMKEMDAVVHLAAIVGDPASALDPKETIKTNYLATKAVAEACKFNQINKFLFASTCSVYGASKNPGDRLKEDSELNPVSLYAETKLESEKGILSLADDNFCPTIFRFATLYGVSPRMRFDLVVNILTAKAFMEGKINIFGGGQWRPNLDVSDAAEACFKWVGSPIAKSGNQIFNVGGNNLNCKILAIGETVKNIIPRAEIIIQKDQDDQRDYNVSFDKIARVLDFKPQKTIQQGVLEMKALLESKKVKDFNDAQYSNYRFLSQMKNQINFK